MNRNHNSVFIRVPLSIVVDYKGFRCLVVSSPPINGDETLFTGPSLNEGSYKINKAIDDDLKHISKNMNLKNHKYLLEEKGTSVDIPLSVLVEVHKVTLNLKEIEENPEENTSYLFQHGKKMISAKKDLECYYMINTAEVIPIDVDAEATGPASFLKRLRYNNLIYSYIICI